MAVTRAEAIKTVCRLLNLPAVTRLRLQVGGLLRLSVCNAALLETHRRCNILVVQYTGLS